MAKRKSKIIVSNDVGKLELSQICDILNKTTGRNVANILDDEDTIKEFIPTGSKWLDRIIGTTKVGGIPLGRMVEIAGFEATGKSLLATIIAGNAQKMENPMQVVYFDAERTLDGIFAQRANVGGIVKVEPSTVEDIMEKIETILGAGARRILFIWDSLAATPTKSELESDFNPQSTIAIKARVLSTGFPKLTSLLKDTDSTLLVINQLKTNITTNFGEQFTEPYMTPGGKSPLYFYSLRIWLTKPKSKASFIENDKGDRIGSTVKVLLKKSKIGGSEGRRCTLQLLWGGSSVGICDKESWLDAIESSESIENNRGRYTLAYENGTTESFTKLNWIEKLKEVKFENRVLQLLDQVLLYNYDKKDD